MLFLRFSLAPLLVLAFAASAIAEEPYAGPAVSGRVGNVNLTAIEMYPGTNDDAGEIIAYYLVTGGNGPLTKVVHIKGRAGASEHMTAEILHGVLYVTNARYGPGEAHCCPTHFDVQKFTMNDVSGTQALTGGRYAVVALPDQPSVMTPATTKAYDREFDRRIETATYR